MARRAKSGAPPDFHLWDEVAATVTPLRPRPLKRKRAEAVAAAAPVPKPAPRRPRSIAMPSYQSPQSPGAPPKPGIEPSLKKKLQRGRIEIDGTLDLHGMRQNEAHAALSRYVHARSARGDRTILVITGKGLKKLDGDAAVIIERGVLRSMLPIWLQSAELAPLIAGWDVSHQSHGGEGAYYVRLKRGRA